MIWSQCFFDRLSYPEFVHGPATTQLCRWVPASKTSPVNSFPSQQSGCSILYMQSLPPYLKDILRREAGETGSPPGYVPVSTYSSRSSLSVQKSPIRNRFMEQAGELQRERTRLKIATGHFIVHSFGGFRTSEKSHHCARSSFS